MYASNKTTTKDGYAVDISPPTNNLRGDFFAFSSPPHVQKPRTDVQKPRIAPVPLKMQNEPCKF